MTRRFKDILLAMARLPLSDQRWILKQLPSAQRVTLEQLQGLQYLQEARRFRTVTAPKTPPLKSSPPPLAVGCDWLAKQDPLYIATVLEQGGFAWTNDFLQQYDEDGMIRASLHHDIAQLKPLTKQMLFIAWEKNTSFERYLEEPNG